MTSYAYESESVTLDALKEWFSDKKKEVYLLGPVLPPGYGTKTQNGEEGTSVEIEKFLGEMLVQHGERSVFFVKILPFSFAFELYTNLFFLSGFLWFWILAISSGIR
jgi:hypothetical protein